MSQPTPAEIEEAATRLYGYSGTPKVLTDTTKAHGETWDVSVDIRTILAALEAAEKERDKYEKAVIDLAKMVAKAEGSTKILTTRAKARCKALERAGNELREEVATALAVLKLPESEVDAMAEWDALINTRQE